MRAHNHQLGFTVLCLCFSDRRFNKLLTHLDGAKTSIPGTSQHIITLDHLLLPYTSTSIGRLAVAVEGRKNNKNWNCHCMRLKYMHAIITLEKKTSQNISQLISQTIIISQLSLSQLKLIQEFVNEEAYTTSKDENKMN